MAESQEREVEAEYEAWKLLLEQMKEADAAQASNLGQVLAPAIAVRFQDLTRQRYQTVELTAQLGTAGIMVAGAVRSTDRIDFRTFWSSKQRQISPEHVHLFSHRPSYASVAPRLPSYPKGVLECFAEIRGTPVGLLTAMCRRFAKPSKKATLETSANSHRANARNSIFAGRQKGGKRQHKATANFLCPRKLKIAPPTGCRWR
jgi:hypothetical protein